MAPTRGAELLAAAIAESADGTDLPIRLLSACAGALSITGAGLGLMSDNGPAGTIAATDGPAVTLEDLQFTLGEGPCSEASRTGRPVLQPDLAVTAPSRWPVFAADALTAGIRAVFALPLRVGAIRLGVLDLYRDSPGPLTAGEFTVAPVLLTDEQLAVVQGLADIATIGLLHERAIRDQVVLAEQLQTALHSRIIIEQAKGVLSARAGTSVSEAFRLMHAYARRTGAPLTTVAEAVVARQLDVAALGG